MIYREQLEIAAVPLLSDIELQAVTNSTFIVTLFRERSRTEANVIVNAFVS